MTSIVIPVLNEERNLTLLLPLLVGIGSSVEIIVSDGGSRDGSKRVSQSFSTIQWISGSSGRGAQMNRGASAARGDVLLFLHADTIPSRGAIEGVAELLHVRQAHFGAFRLRFDPPTWLPSTLAVLTTFASPLCCFGDQGIFCRADFFWSTGGFPETALLEDVHWVRRAAKRGRMVRSPLWSPHPAGDLKQSAVFECLCAISRSLSETCWDRILPVWLRCTSDAVDVRELAAAATAAADETVPECARTTQAV